MLIMVKVVTRYIKIHYEKSQNVNLLVLIRSCVHKHGIYLTYMYM